MSLFLSGQIGDAFKSWKLDAPVTTIGRSSRNTIQIADPTVSKEHAELAWRGERLFVRDLGSRNGTRVNGAEAREAIELRPNDHLEVGHVAMRVTRDEPSREVRYSDATIVGSSMRVSVDQVLERRARAGDPSGTLVHVLAEAGRLLVLPRPLKETCEEVIGFVEKTVPASRTMLLLRETPEGEPVLVAGRTRGGGEGRPLAMSRAIVQTVLDDNASVLTRDAASDPRFQGHESIVAQSVRSAMAVPLFDNEQVLGLLYVDSHDLTSTFTEEQLEILTLLANMAAIKITNARLLDAEQARARLAQELASATQIQRGLLPVKLPAVPGFEIDAYLDTCYEVGGDLYDFRMRSDGRLLFMIGDVSGKGMGAALLMSSFLASARVLYETCQDPGELAARLSEIVHQSTDSRNFITGIVGCLDPASGSLHYVNAGHPSACLVKGGELRALESAAVPFGILPSFPYKAEQAEIRPGETLALFSDGIPEAQRGEEMFDDARIYEALKEGADGRPLPEVREHLLGRIATFLDGAAQTDDVTLLLIRRA